MQAEINWSANFRSLNSPTCKPELNPRKHFVLHRHFHQPRTTFWTSKVFTAFHPYPTLYASFCAPYRGPTVGWIKAINIFNGRIGKNEIRSIIRLHPRTPEITRRKKHFCGRQFFANRFPRCFSSTIPPCASPADVWWRNFRTWLWSRHRPDRHP